MSVSHNRWLKSFWMIRWEINITVQKFWEEFFSHIFVFLKYLSFDQYHLSVNLAVFLSFLMVNKIMQLLRISDVLGLMSRAVAVLKAETWGIQSATNACWICWDWALSYAPLLESMNIDRDLESFLPIVLFPLFFLPFTGCVGVEHRCAWWCASSRIPRWEG